MLNSINQMSGVTPRLAAQLRARCVNTGAQLLQVTQTPQARQALAQEMGVDQRFILDLAGRADLARIPSLDAVQMDLLEAAGVQTVAALAKRSPPDLYHRLMEINYFQRLAEVNPTLAEVHQWIAEARMLPSMLKH